MSKDPRSDGREPPRVIVGMSRAEWERDQFFEAKQQTFPPDVLPVVVDKHRPSADPRLQNLIDRQILVPDVLLVRSPFNTGRYVVESHAVLEFQREKMELVARLCRILGAVQVDSRLETLELRTQERTGRFGAGKKAGRANLGRGDTSVSLKDRNAVREELSMSRSFPPSGRDIEQALRFIDQHNLWDPEIEGLVAARHGSEPATHLRVRVTFEAEQDRALKVSGSIKLPVWFADGSYEDKRTYKQRISMELDVSFADGT